MNAQESTEIAKVLHRLADHIQASAAAPAVAAEVPPLDRCLASLRRLGFVPQHVLDVGAHRGGWTRRALRYFPDASYTLVEPQAELKADMQDLLALPRVRVHTCGAGPETGEMTFTLAERDDSSTFALSAEEAAERGLRQVVLPVVTIDDLVAQSGLPAPEVVKIDAEGLDLEVLRGAERILPSCEVLFLEASIMAKGMPNDLMKVMTRAAELGFRPFDFTDLNRTQKHGALWLVEVAFVRADGMIDRAVDRYA